MREMKVVKVKVYTEQAGEYEYSRHSEIALSEEHFTNEEKQNLMSQFIAVAVSKGLSISTSRSTVEVPEDEEESYKVKYENLSKQNSDHYTERAKLRKEIEKLEAEVETLKSICPTSHTEQVAEDDDEQVL